MKTKLVVLVSVIALLLCGVVTMAYAQGSGPEGKAFAGGRGHGWGMGFWSGELNLTDAQKAQIKTILQENRTTMKSVAQQMEQNRAAFLAATANGTYDAGKMQTLANQQARLQAAMTANREAIKHQIYTQVLTADQQAKVEQLRTQQINRINEHLQKMANGTDVPSPPAQQ
jgi:Spy/CpxP family protein refolding chaperone